MKLVEQEKRGDYTVQVWEAHGPLPYAFMIVHHGSTYEFPALAFRFVDGQAAMAQGWRCVEWIRKGVKK